MAKGSNAKVNGTGISPFPSPKDGTVAKTNVNYSLSGGTGSSFSPLTGAGEDSRPRVDDNKPGKNRWPMGEKSEVDGDKNRYGRNKSLGSGPKNIR